MRKVMLLVITVFMLTTLFSTGVDAATKTTKKPVVGKLEGAVTYQYNKFIGTKADVGAVVYLIPKKQKKASITTQQMIDISDKKIKANSVGIYYTKVNGKGDYKISGIPEGDYIILIISLNTTRDFLTKYDDKAATKLLKPYFKDWNNLSTGMLEAFKSVAEEITITGNDTTDYSHDFGYSYL
ncbi:hypothetical protein MHB85_30665 [Paenibacillus sp. FSL K6-4396]|uniref:hypothetical protein n=1 Tax=unclassified Paenibacillus TaxID=185978 RepID=UPI00177F6B45|nr:hypothetical protein [Paenibacillus sp. CFBP 13594]MBD8841989.1 hypothetical protein [Paenibacillus sp. CFBP 13594]